MKRLLATLLLPLAFLACSTKKDSPAPDAGTAVSGNYQLSRRASFSNDDPVYDVRLPKTTGTSTETGTLVITRSSATAVYVAVVLQIQQGSDVTNVSSATTTFGKMDVKTTGTGYELSQYNTNSQKTGTTDGSAMNIEMVDTYVPTMTTYRYVLEAKR